MSQLVKSLLSVEANVFMRNVHLFYLVLVMLDQAYMTIIGLLHVGLLGSG